MKRAALFLAAIAAVPMSASGWQTQPATTETGTERLVATMTAVQGTVQVRKDENSPWQIATVGMELPENAEIRTLFRSSAQFKYPPDQTVTVDRASVVKVVQAEIENGKVKTNIGMKYGRTVYQIEAAGREHEATISSPSNTLAVRGTDFVDEDQRPFPAQAISYRGRVERRGLAKRTSFGSQAGGKTVINANDPNAASTAVNSTVVDPSIVLARSQSETA